MATTATKTCTKCGKTKNLTNYSPSGKSHRSACKECRRSTATTAEATPSGVKTSGAPTPKTNPKKSKKTGNPKEDKANQAAKTNRPSKPGSHSVTDDAVPSVDDLNAALNRVLDPGQYDPNSLLRPLRERGNGWTPGLQMEMKKDGTEEGTITTGAMLGDTRDVTWDSILEEWSLSAEEFEVVEPITVNVWDAPAGNGETIKMRQVKGRVIKRVIGGSGNGADIGELVELLHKREKPTPIVAEEDGCFTVVIADMQSGKGEGGGSSALLGRFLHFYDAVEMRIKELRELGRPLNTLQILMPGDTIEGCSDQWYQSQVWETDLHVRNQSKLARHILTEALIRWTPYFSKTRVVAVAGNHGERRSGKKMSTEPSDSLDIEVVENVSEAFRLAGRDDVEFVLGLGEDPLVAVVETCGWSLGMIHGHFARAGGTGAAGKIEKYYQSMSAARAPIGSVDCLITGHWHSLIINDHGSWIHLQAPATDGGSDSFTSGSGKWSEPGLLTFATYPTERATDIQVLKCPPSLRGGPMVVPQR